MRPAAPPAVTPPSTTMVSPVTKLEASEARKSSGPTSSLGLPTRFMGERPLAQSRKPGMPKRPAVISLGNHPGAMALTRTPRLPQLDARWRVRLTTAPLEA
jgi:hypothetical protein